MSRFLHLIAVALLASWLATNAKADTYAAWKARVFSAQEQADSTISGENANPAGDGIKNLTKYALALDPHQNEVGRLPVVSIDGNNLMFTYRVPYDTPSDLNIFPEVSPDLSVWHRGSNAVEFYYNGYDTDAYLYTYRAISPVTDNPRMFMRLTVLEGNILPDWWQIQNFGHTGVVPTADADGDGLSNFDEYMLDSDPNDIYSPTPYLTIAGGNQQGGPVNQFLPQPLVVRVFNVHNQPILNAPVQFMVNSGGGKLSLATTNQPLIDTLSVHTNASGLAQVFYQQGASVPVQSEVDVQAVNNGQVSATQAFHSATATAPVISVISPQAGSTVSTSQVIVSVQVTADALLKEVRMNSILVQQDQDQPGRYTHTLTLPEGQQTINLGATNAYGMTSTQTLSIIVSSQPANLAILSPTDNQSFTTRNVFVQTHADSSQASVVINGIAASQNGSNFNAWVTLSTGANTITATLTDSTGRHSTDSVVVQYNPPPGGGGSNDRDGDGVPDDQDLFPMTTIIGQTVTETVSGTTTIPLRTILTSRGQFTSPVHRTA